MTDCSHEQVEEMMVTVRRCRVCSSPLDSYTAAVLAASVRLERSRVTLLLRQFAAKAKSREQQQALEDAALAIELGVLRP